MFKSLVETANDMVSGFRRWELWSLLAWNDIRKKYRRSVVGPFWASLSFALFGVAIGILYSELFQIPISVYLPHVLLGLLAWNLISQVVIEGCLLFTSMRVYILEVDLPLTLFVFVLLWKKIILFAFGFFVYIIASVFLMITPGISWVYGFAGLLLIVINALWMGLLVAITSARYPDFVEIVGSAFRLLFFVTPIIWMPEFAGRRGDLVSDLNPFYHLVEIFRGSIIDGTISSLSWTIAIMMGIGGWIVTSVLYHKYKNRITFWL